MGLPREIHDLIDTLPQDLAGELVDFLDYLQHKRERHLAEDHQTASMTEDLSRKLEILQAEMNLLRAGGPSLEEVRNQPGISADEFRERLRAQRASS